MKKFLLFNLLFCFFIQSAELLEINDKPDDVNIKVIKILADLTEGDIKKLDKTRGFTYRYNTKWYSPFSLDIYIGNVKKGIDSTLIRVESYKRGEEKLIKTILKKGILKPEELDPKETELEKSISKKSHFISQSINVLMPYSAILYNSYNSPTYTFRDTIMGVSIYTFWDMLLFGLGAFYISNTVKGKSFQDDLVLKKGPRYGILQSKIGGVLIVGLAASRLYRTWGNYEDISVHNRAAELSYTFSF